MKYESIVKGKFISRPNRFIAIVEVEGKTETVHVKNTGRCKELLVEGATVFLEKSNNPERKTKYDLIAVYKGDNLINMDSQAPNEMVYEWLALGNLFSKNAKIKREVTFGDSRFDIYIEEGEKKAFIEVKGVTLENDGVASFPDAPTERGIKHIKELISARERGYDTYIFFVIQMKGVTKFEPSYKNHMEFAKALKEAQDRGVKILAYDSIVTPDEIKIDKPVAVEIE